MKVRIIKQHTLQKLEYFKKYLDAYLIATKILPKKYYIDAFAGTGECVVAGNNKSVCGSALIALEAKNKFDSYIFIEKPKIAKILEKIIQTSKINKELLKKIKILHGDCNQLLPEIVNRLDLNAGYLIFFDPEGPELFWNTISCLSKIKKTDILILYPYDMSLVRLINEYPDKLNKFYGIPQWKEIYKSRNNAKDAREKLLDFYISNLKSLGFKYVVYRQIKTSLRSGHPLYHLILVTNHWAGEKIMRNIFDKELDGQMKLKFYPQS